MRNRLLGLTKAFVSERKANVAVTFALAVIPVIAAVGMAIDYSGATAYKAKLQGAMDAAVLAGVTQSSASAQTERAMQTFLANLAGVAAPTPTFTPDMANQTLSGQATAEKPIAFLRLISINSIPVQVKSTAKVATASSSVCILLVDPTQSQAFLVNGGAKINGPQCEIHVRSTASPAAIINASTTLNVKRICVKGTNVIVNGGATPPLEKGCNAIADPFENKLPTVSVGSCSYNNQVYNPGNVTINPGVYCGWTNFNGTGNLTLNPGLYIIKDGGMTFNSGWTVTGTGVTFYLVNQNSTITFNGNVNAKLSAPTSGAYQDILIFEPPGLSNSNLPINGTSGTTFSGLFYLPSREVTINSVSNVSADKVTMVFSSLILNNTNWSFAPGSKAMSAQGTPVGAHLTK